MTSRNSGGTISSSSNPLSGLTAQQKSRVADFRNITDSSAKAAVDILRKHNWSLDQSLDAYYAAEVSSSSSSMSSSSSFVLPTNASSSGRISTTTLSSSSSKKQKVDMKKIENFFSCYEEREGGGEIQEKGVARLVADLDLDLLDPVTLVLAYRCKCRDQGVFTKEEFKTGMLEVGADSLERLAEKLPLLRKDLKDPKRCKEIYTYAFVFSLDCGQKNLPVDLSVMYWNLLLSDCFPLLDEWLEFVKTHCKNSISKDTWVMLYDFATTCTPDLSDYDFDGAWPVIIDEFVEWFRKRRPPQPLTSQNAQTIEEDGSSTTSSSSSSRSGGGGEKEGGGNAAAVAVVIEE